MAAIFVSILLFGLVHPLGKIILDTGIPLSYFCLLFVAIRLVVQVPVIFLGDFRGMGTIQALVLLVLLGLCGAGLQYFEFKGLREGLAPGLVTLLMFSYPVWIIIGNVFKQSKPPLGTAILKILLVLSGVYFVSRGQISVANSSPVALVYPIIAGLFIAFWILLSSQLRKQGVGSLSLSLSYDFFSSLSLVIILSGSLVQDFAQFNVWAAQENHLAYLFLFSTLVGFLPNLLFYHGCRFVSPLVAALAMAMEPVLSTTYSAFLWHMDLRLSFALGTLFILLANIPNEALVRVSQQSLSRLLSQRVFRGKNSHTNELAAGLHIASDT